VKLWPWAGGAAVAVTAWSAAMHPWGWLFALGVHPYPGPSTPWTYQLESGFVPSLTVLTLLSLVSGAWQHVNCHHRWCLRPGKHKVNGTPWCDRHHHEARPERTENEILQAIEQSLLRLLARLEHQEERE
jgi:hypothetical protein